MPNPFRPRGSGGGSSGAPATSEGPCCLQRSLEDTPRDNSRLLQPCSAGGIRLGRSTTCYGSAQSYKLLFSFDKHWHPIQGSSGNLRWPWHLQWLDSPQPNVALNRPAPWMQAWSSQDPRCAPGFLLRVHGRYAFAMRIFLGASVTVIVNLSHLPAPSSERSALFRTPKQQGWLTSQAILFQTLVPNPRHLFCVPCVLSNSKTVSTFSWPGLCQDARQEAANLYRGPGTKPKSRGGVHNPATRPS